MVSPVYFSACSPGLVYILGLSRRPFFDQTINRCVCPSVTGVILYWLFHSEVTGLAASAIIIVASSLKGQRRQIVITCCLIHLIPFQKIAVRHTKEKITSFLFWMSTPFQWQQKVLKNYEKEIIWRQKSAGRVIGRGGKKDRERERDRRREMRESWEVEE